MIKSNDNFLLTYKTWQKAMAKSNHELFLKEVTETLKKNYHLSSTSKILLVCADDTNLQQLEWMVNHFQSLSIGTDVYVSPKLQHQWLKKSVQKLLNQYDFVFDLIGDAHDIKLLEKINALNGFKVSLNMPTGIHPDTGYFVQDKVFKAHVTFCHLAYLQGVWTSVAKEFVGQLILVNANHMPSDICLTKVSSLPYRLAYAYKGQFRRVFVLVGHPSMFGAGILAAWAALIAGSGWVEVFYPQELQAPYGDFPEIIWSPCQTLDEIKSKLRGDDILIVGPGLRDDGWGILVWQWLQSLDNTIVLDAGGLSWLAKLPQLKKNWILTPHPGEAAQLLNVDVKTIQKDRYQAIQKLHQKYQSTIVLKGSGTLILADGQFIKVCPFGHPGMAIQGMGDALTGLIAGFVAQHFTPFNACELAVSLHACAAMRWLGQTVRPSQLLYYLQENMQDVVCSYSNI